MGFVQIYIVLELFRTGVCSRRVMHQSCRHRVYVLEEVCAGEKGRSSLHPFFFRAPSIFSVRVRVCLLLVRLCVVYVCFVGTCSVRK